MYKYLTVLLALFTLMPLCNDGRFSPGTENTLSSDSESLDNFNPEFTTIPENQSEISYLSSVEITFNKQVFGAESTANYELSGDGTVNLSLSSIESEDGLSFKLIFSGVLSEGGVSITLSNIADESGNPVIEDIFFIGINISVFEASIADGVDIQSDFRYFTYKTAADAYGGELISSYQLAGAKGDLEITNVIANVDGTFLLEFSGSADGDFEIITSFTDILGEALQTETISFNLDDTSPIITFSSVENGSVISSLSEVQLIFSENLPNNLINENINLSGSGLGNLDVDNITVKLTDNNETIYTINFKGSIESGFVRINFNDVIDEAGNELVFFLEYYTDESQIPQLPVVNLATNFSSIVEGNTITLSANISAAYNKEIIVPIIFSGTAIKNIDYTYSSTSIIIPIGASYSFIEIKGVDDILIEPGETIQLNVGTIENATVDTITEFIVEIEDNDSLPIVSLFLDKFEMNEEGGSVSLSALLNKTSTSDVVINFAFNGSAQIDEDYTITDAILTIPAGSVLASTTIISNSDNLDENIEQVLIKVDTISGAVYNQDETTININDDDVSPIITYGFNKLIIGENQQTATLFAFLSAKSGKDIELSFNLSGSAILNTHYSINNQTLIIPAGSISGQIII